MSVMIANAVLFQALWFVAVQGDSRWAFLGLIVYTLVHLAWFFKKRAELIFCVSAGIGGWLLDSVLANLGVIRFSGLLAAEFVGNTVYFAPAWLLCIWLGFTPTLLFSLSWLAKRPMVSVFMGFGMVPLSYLGGAYLSGSELGYSNVATYIIMGSVWALLLPLLMFFAAGVYGDASASNFRNVIHGARRV